MLPELEVVLQVLAYILLLIILITYYDKARRQFELRKFWWLLALAWTMNLLANIAWIVRDIVTGTTLDSITILDLFYITPYILIGYTLWFYPKVLPLKTWIWISISLAIAFCLVLAIYYGLVADRNRGTMMNFTIYAIYPILDIGVIVLAWIRHSLSRATHWAKISLLLALALTSSGLANSVELAGYIFSPILDGALENFLWLMKHILVLSIAIRVKKPTDVLQA